MDDSQLGLFATGSAVPAEPVIRTAEQALMPVVLEAAYAAGIDVAVVEPGPEFAAYEGLQKRRAARLHSAKFWRDAHARSGLSGDWELRYAAALTLIANDMVLHPEYYARQPPNIGDFDWWRLERD